MSASAAEVKLEFLFSLSGITAAAKADFSKSLTASLKACSTHSTRVFACGLGQRRAILIPRFRGLDLPFLRVGASFCAWSSNTEAAKELEAKS